MGDTTEQRKCQLPCGLGECVGIGNDFLCNCGSAEFTEKEKEKIKIERLSNPVTYLVPRDCVR